MDRYRNYFRIEYPPEIRPVFECNGEKLQVLNVSEQGIKCVISDTGKNVGQKVRGTLCFSNPEDDGNKWEIEGKIIRKETGKIAIALSDGVPWKKIMTEQRYILRKFGTIKQPEIP